jgi:formylmethanofuran dehydrogenase subunit E
MAKGLLKYFMLKLISERKHSGYELIKEIEEHSGNKPSTGTVYPLLKSMQNEGWIKGINRDEKTYYEITKSGKEKLNEYNTIKQDYITKMHESVSIINETFHQEGHLMYIEQIELIHPLIEEIIKSQNKGIKQEQIDEVILHAIEQLKQLRNGGG